MLPPALWGWSLVRRRVPTRMGLRLIAWIAAIGPATGVLAFLPTPASWPLPTGLGGLIGAGFSNLAAMVTGAHPQPVTAWLFAIILVAPALALFWLAVGPRRTIAEDGKPRQGARARPSAPTTSRERNGVLDVAARRAGASGFSAAADGPSAAHRPGARRTPTPGAKPKRRSGVTAPASRMMAGATPVSERASPASAASPRSPSTAAIIDAHARRAGRDYRSKTRPTSSTRTRRRARASPPPPSARRPGRGPRAKRRPRCSTSQSGFELPPLSLLAEPQAQRASSDEHRPERLEAMARRLEGVLEDFGVKGDIINVRPGPVVTLYELEPAPGIKSSRVISLADDIARSMSAISARVAVVPGRNAIGIELPNENRETVYLREMLASADFEKMKGKLPICLGKTIGGEPIIADLARMPHLLIAGTTGSGKSVGINTMILSILYRMTPERVPADHDRPQDAGALDL